MIAPQVRGLENLLVVDRIEGQIMAQIISCWSLCKRREQCWLELALQHAMPL